MAAIGHDPNQQLPRWIDRYELLERIGAGTSGIVYLARQRGIERMVAIKELPLRIGMDPVELRRFSREARLAGQIMHPNIVAVFDFVETDTSQAIAMELVHRGALRANVGTMSLAQIGTVLHGILMGLAAAHDAGIVHRDLKPENVLVDAGGGVKLADFGLARAFSATRDGSVLTPAGMTAGTPAYMAPEQVRGEYVGPAADLYSLGAMAWELATGQPPFGSDDQWLKIAMRHLQDPLPRLTDIVQVPPALGWWVERLLAKQPDYRHPTARNAAAELLEVLDSALTPGWRLEGVLGDNPRQAFNPQAQQQYQLPATEAEVIVARALAEFDAAQDSGQRRASIAQAWQGLRELGELHLSVRDAVRILRLQQEHEKLLEQPTGTWQEVRSRLEGDLVQVATQITDKINSDQA